jgi:MFS family permease
LAIFLCNFLAAGPVIAIVEIAETFFPPQLYPDVPGSISKTAYFFTTTALMQGVSNFFWMPAINKWGRRPAYVVSFLGYTACAVWAGVAKSYGSELAARIVTGFMAGSGECLAPLTISDLWFLHERGYYMAYIPL